MGQREETTFENPGDSENPLLDKVPPALLRTEDDDLTEEQWVQGVTVGEDDESEDVGKLPASLTERALTEAIEDARRECWEEFAYDEDQVEEFLL